MLILELLGSPESVNIFGLAKILHLLHSYSVQRRMLALKTFTVVQYINGHTLSQFAHIC